MFSRDEQVSPPIINMVDLYAYEELADTETESSDETMSEVYSPFI